MSYKEFKKQLKKNKERADKEKKERMAIYSMEKMSGEFAKRKSEYLEKAKQALKEGDNDTYARYISLIKNIMFQKAQIDDMLTNYRMARDMRDMGRLRTGFADTLDTVMSDVYKMSEKLDFKKSEKIFAKGIYANTQAAEKLQRLLKMNGVSFSDYADKVSGISESDLKYIIESEINKDNADVDARLSEFEAELMGDEQKSAPEKIPMGGAMPTRSEPVAPAENPYNPTPSYNVPTPENPDWQTPQNPNWQTPQNPNWQVPPYNGVPAPSAGGSYGATPSWFPANNVPEQPNYGNPPQPQSQPQPQQDNLPNVIEVPESTDTPSPEDKVLNEGTTTVNDDFKFDWDSLPAIKFDDIAGLESVKQMVQIKVILPLKQPDLFEGYVKKNGGGMLLYGPPGTGKTMIGAAIANEIGAKFCSVKPSDLLHQGAGNTEKAVRSLFSQARSFPCAVIYFDEMDSITPKSTKSQYAKQLRSELLSQLQGIESYGKDTGNILFLIAATNKPWDIDSAFIRPGRFGTRVYVGLPDDPARKYMVEHRLDKIKSKGIVKVADDIDLDSIVERTNGFNGSDLTNLTDRVEEISMIRSITTGEKTIGNEDFDTAFESVSSTVQREDIEKLLEWKKANE